MLTPVNSGERKILRRSNPHRWDDPGGTDCRKLTRKTDPSKMNRINKETYVRMRAEGVAQAQIARVMGVSRASVCKMERNLESLKTQGLFSRIVAEYASKKGFGTRLKVLSTERVLIQRSRVVQLQEFNRLMDEAKSGKNPVKRDRAVLRLAREELKLFHQILSDRSTTDTIADLEH